DAGHLRLNGGGVVITLGLPEGATLTSRIIDLSPVRIACLYSLVVNRHRETYAEVLTVYDLDGQSFTEQHPCAVEILADSPGVSSSTEDSQGPFIPPPIAPVSRNGRARPAAQS